MNVPSTTFSSYEQLTLPSVALEATDSTVSPLGRRIRALWLGPLRWVQDGTYERILEALTQDLEDRGKLDL